MRRVGDEVGKLNREPGSQHWASSLRGSVWSWGPLIGDLDASVSQQKYKYQCPFLLEALLPQKLKCWTKNICSNMKVKPQKVTYV